MTRSLHWGTQHPAQVVAIAVSVAAGAVLHGLAGGEGTPFRLWLVLMVLVAAMIPPRGHRPDRPGIGRKLFLVDRMLIVVLCTGLSLVLAWWIAGPDAVPPLFVGLVAACGLLACPLIDMTLGRLTQLRGTRYRFAVYGANEQGISVARHLAETAPYVEVVGFLDDPASPTSALLPFPRLDLPGSGARSLPFLDGVIVALPGAGPAVIEAVRQRLHDRVALLLLAPNPAALELDSARACRIGSLDCSLVGTGRLGAQDRVAKRLLDILVASVALLLALPVLAVCAVAIKLESPGPVIYRQRRYTTQMRLFDCYKLRTMRHNPQRTGIELAQRNDARVTQVGRFLRRTSIDEIPQFFNVLQGHMSVVGPRPHPPGVKAGNRLYEEVVPDFFERYRVKPGITGWAQVSGLRGNTFEPKHLEQRFRHDLEYIAEWSLAFEVLIIAKTVFGGFGGRNAF